MSQVTYLDVRHDCAASGGLIDSSYFFQMMSDLKNPVHPGQMGEVRD